MAGDHGTASPLSAEQIIRQLELKPHPEGGHFRESFRDSVGHGDRAHSTAIYFLLAEGEVSHWHRVDATEIWHWYLGAPLELVVETPGGIERMVLGPGLDRDEQPQLVIPKLAWQSARSLGDWTLVGCTVAPGFEFSGFDLAPPDWRPPGA